MEDVEEDEIHKVKMAKGATGRWAAGGLPVARARRRWRDASVGRARRALSAGTRASGSSEAGPRGSGVHQPGDIVTISTETLGALTNRVRLSTECPPWTYGASRLMRDLARAGLI